MADSITTVEVAAGGGGFAAVWLGVRWALTFLIGRHDKRTAELDRREAELDDKIAKRLNYLEVSLEKLEEDQKRSRVVVGILIAKVARDDPGAPELAQVRQILGVAFPLDFTVPADLAAVVTKLP